MGVFFIYCGFRVAINLGSYSADGGGNFLYFLMNHGRKYSFYDTRQFANHFICKCKCNKDIFDLMFRKVILWSNSEVSAIQVAQILPDSGAGLGSRPLVSI